MTNSLYLPRLVTAALFSAVLAGTWDVWWHGALGRESFWSPPHLLLYLSVLVAVGLGVYGWRRFQSFLWKRLAILLVLIPASAPVDDFWHRTFGIETVASPVIVWSPPHLLLAGALIGSFVMLLPLLRQDKDISARRLFGSLALASILALLAFMVSPLEPTGPYHLLGFWGAGFMGLVLSGVFLWASRWLPGVGGALTLSFSYIVLVAMDLTERLSPNVVVPSHEHAPSWLLIFAFVIPAVFVDLSRRLPLWLRGAGAALLWSGTLYIFARAFFSPEFQYGNAEILAALVSSLIGGLAASGLVRTMTSSEPAVFDPGP